MCQEWRTFFLFSSTTTNAYPHLRIEKLILISQEIRVYQQCAVGVRHPVLKESTTSTRNSSIAMESGM